MSCKTPQRAVRVPRDLADKISQLATRITVRGVLDPSELWSLTARSALERGLRVIADELALDDAAPDDNEADDVAPAPGEA